MACDICKNNANVMRNGLEITISCPRCGTYHENPAIGWLNVQSIDHQVRLSGWVREQNDFGIVPPITPEVSRRIAVMRLPRLRDRANRALHVIAQLYPQLEGAKAIGAVTTDERLLATTYSRDETEIRNLLHILLDEGHLRGFEDNTTHRLSAVALTSKGMLAAEALQLSVPNSAQGFVAMSFSEELREAWVNGFDPAIRAAGYRPMRIDAKDYAGGVMDEIIAEIRQSRFVVADCTQQRNGVYYEAGFAVGLGLTVIPTCRGDDMKNRHFDIQHLNTLEWKKPADLISKLAERIIAVVGAGPDLPPK